MWDLVEIYLGNAEIVDHGLTLVDCLREAVRQMYISDGMSIFSCEATL